jgi:hypothetical protein
VSLQLLISPPVVFHHCRRPTPAPFPAAKTTSGHAPTIVP